MICRLMALILCQYFTRQVTTATVTVKVDQDSLDNVSITAKTSITDIAGNALVEAVVNNSQEVDTRIRLRLNRSGG